MTAIYVALVIYMVVLFGVGLFYSQKNATINDFLLAGRDLGLVAATLTVTASLFGGGLLTGSAQYAYDSGVMMYAYGILGSGGGLLLAALLVHKMKDFYLLYFAKDADPNDKRLVVVSQIFTVVAGGVFVLFALSTGFNVAGIGCELLSGILSAIVLVVVSLATQPKEIARALMLMQLMSIGKGYSAVSLEMLEQIRTYLNADLYPYAPCEGTIGGLSFQPYIAITYMGEGRLIDGGKVRPTAEVLKEKGIAPLKVKAREGLALLSNASHSLGVGLLALYDFVMTMRHADLTAALVCEALRSTDKAYDPRLIALKNHKETTETAQFLRDILSGTALMGSNWDATAIELYCDSLAIAVMDVAKLTEVHMERLVDPHLSGLPAFLVKNPGLNNGFMIPQYVTAGLLGDIALLCAPAAAFNAAVSAGQESPVYRDDTAARQLYQAVQKLRSLVSMTMLTALQAIDLSDHKAMSPVTQKIHDHARQTVTFMENDDLMYQRIEAMEHLVESNQLLADCPLPFTI